MAVSVPGITWQRIRSGDRSSYKDLSIVIEPAEFGMDRDRLAGVLLADGVDTRKYYSPLVHRHPAFAGSHVEAMPGSEWIESRALSLPLFSHMPAATMRTIAQLVAAAHREATAISGAVGQAARTRVA